MTNLVKINPQEYGLQENEVKTIEQAFTPKIIERDELTKTYEILIKQELTKDLCSDASTLRKKLVKVRTGIADIHKSQKAYFLAAGRFVDAWKNKETEPIEQMESKLSEIELYFENLEKERIKALEAERLEKVLQYTEFPATQLTLMEEATFNAYLSGLKVAYDAKIKAEQEAEEERLRLIEVEKENARLKAIEDEKIRKENERLKKEAEAKEKELEAERKKQADILAKLKADADAKIAEQKRLANVEAKKQADIIAEQNRKLKEKEDAERSENLRLENERKAKEQAEKEALKSPDKTKLTDWVNSMQIIIPQLKSNESNAVANVIKEKFDAFKVWAESQIKSI